MFYELSKHIVYHNVKTLPIGTIEPVVPQNDTLEQKHTYLHSKTWYVQHVFTRYRSTSMYAIDAKLKILKF